MIQFFSRPSIDLSLTRRSVLVAVLAGLCFALVPATVGAETEEELLARREHWQAKYRMMLQNRLTLQENIAKLEHDYAQAQRRNYPRGGARAALLDQANEAREELKGVEAEIAGIYDEARANEVPPGWLAEVEDEPLEAHPPASATDAEEVEEDDGRNPLYK